MFSRIIIVGLFTTLISFITGTSLGAELVDISQEKVLEKITKQEDVLILDVRTAEEFADGRVFGATNVPHKTIEQSIAALEQYKDKEIIVYCRSGKRATIAADKLMSNGFTNVKHLQGDMLGWQEKGLPVSK